MSNRRRQRLLCLVLLFTCALALGCGGAGGGGSTTGGDEGVDDATVSAYEEAQHYMGQAGLALSEDDHQGALEYYLEAARVYDGLGETSIERAEAHFLAAGEAYKIGNPNQAIDEYQIAVDIYLKFKGNSRIKAAVGLNNMGSIFKGMEEYDKARNCWNNALQIYKEAPPELQNLSHMETIEQNLSDLQEGF